jgi:uncharacterized protein YecT (DUF1311 family)
MNKLAIIAIAALVIATAASSVAIAQQSALAGDRDRDVNQEGKCRNCQQQQAVDNDDSLNTESGDVELDDDNDVSGSISTGDALGGQFQERTGGG